MASRAASIAAQERRLAELERVRQSEGLSADQRTERENLQRRRDIRRWLARSRIGAQISAAEAKLDRLRQRAADLGLEGYRHG